MRSRSGQLLWLALVALVASLLITRHGTRWALAYLIDSDPVSETQSTASQFAPTNLTATGLVGATSLSWTAPAGGWATGYQVYRGTASGGPYILLTSGGCRAPVSFTGCNDNTILLGTYYYVVRGISGYGGSVVNSNQASVFVILAAEERPDPFAATITPIVTPSVPSTATPEPDAPVLPGMATVAPFLPLATVTQVPETATMTVPDPMPSPAATVTPTPAVTFPQPATPTRLVPATPTVAASATATTPSFPAPSATATAGLATFATATPSPSATSTATPTALPITPTPGIGTAR